LLDKIEKIIKTLNYYNLVLMSTKRKKSIDGKGVEKILKSIFELRN